jgi:hypothetical protein
MAEIALEEIGASLLPFAHESRAASLEQANRKTLRPPSACSCRWRQGQPDFQTNAGYRLN